MLSNTLNQIGTDHVYKMQKSSPTREHTNLLSIIRDTHLCITLIESLLPWKSLIESLLPWKSAVSLNHERDHYIKTE